MWQFAKTPTRELLRAPAKFANVSQLVTITNTSNCSVHEPAQEIDEEGVPAFYLNPFLFRKHYGAGA